MTHATAVRTHVGLRKSRAEHLLCLVVTAEQTALKNVFERMHLLRG